MTLKSLQAYGKGFQLKVLGSLLTDKTFLLNVRDVLKDTYFDADSHKWIVSEIIDYFDKYHTTITMDVLKVELQKVENEVLQVALKEELRNSYAASQDDLARLVDIEQEMLAIREMFRQGEISRSVYVAETKALYETARLVKP